MKNQLSDTISAIAQQADTTAVAQSTSIWFYVTIAEFAIILALVAFIFAGKHKANDKKELKAKVLGETSGIDFGNVLNSSFHARELYDELKGKCHPDKFKDEALNQEATDIFQLLQKHRYDYQELLALKARAQQNLHI